VSGADEETASPASRRVTRERAADLIAVGCSAGGPAALEEVLPQLPARTLTTVLVAQHMPGRFIALFAERLGRSCALPVRQPVDGEPLRPGCIYLAPGGRQTWIEKGSGSIQFRVRSRDATERHAPSIDLLMVSVAQAFGRRALGVVMTGMGSDGVQGLRAIRERGGRTIAESEETASVFGMPREVIRAGLADQVLPRGEIARRLASLCRR